MRSERFYPISLISRFFAERRAYSKGCWIFRMPRELASILAPKRRRRFSGSIELISEQSTWFQPLRSISTTATYSSSIRPVEAFRWVYAEIATERIPALTEKLCPIKRRIKDETWPRYSAARSFLVMSFGTKQIGRASCRERVCHYV